MRQNLTTVRIPKKSKESFRGEINHLQETIQTLFFWREVALERSKLAPLRK